MIWDGPPKDVDGECNARLYIGDDYGDNCATVRCPLALGHDGPHTEAWTRDEPGEAGYVCITWERDEKPSREALEP